MSTPAAPLEPSTSDSPFRVSIADAVAHIRLDRPDKANTMTRAFWRELPTLVRRLSDEAAARCIVISSTGKHFSAGMDLAVFAEEPALASVDRASPEADNEAFRHLVLGLQATFNALEEARMPVLAAIQGGCIGGAVDMVSACDIRYCTADAFFQIQEINIGMTADVGTFPRLCKLIPDGAVRELAYTGRRLPAQKALAIGLVNEVYVDHQTMIAAVLETAREIARKAPVAIAGSKLAITFARDHSVRDGLDQIALWQAGMHSRSAMREAFAAQQEKRQPNFTDLAPVRRGL
jgi:enoyl-CoA hydratase